MNSPASPGPRASISPASPRSMKRTSREAIIPGRPWAVSGSTGSPPATPARWTTSSAATTRASSCVHRCRLPSPGRAPSSSAPPATTRPARSPSIRRRPQRLDRPLRLGRPTRACNRRTPSFRLPRHPSRPPPRSRSHAPRPHRRAFESRSYVDTGPLIERDLARQAGIGWTAKNTCTLNQQLGSMLFLCCIVTSLEVAPASRPTPGR